MASGIRGRTWILGGGGDVRCLLPGRGGRAPARCRAQHAAPRRRRIAGTRVGRERGHAWAPPSRSPGGTESAQRRAAAGQLLGGGGGRKYQKTDPTTLGREGGKRGGEWRRKIEGEKIKTEERGGKKEREKETCKIRAGSARSGRGARLPAGAPRGAPRPLPAGARLPSVCYSPPHSPQFVSFFSSAQGEPEAEAE